MAGRRHLREILVTACLVEALELKESLRVCLVTTGQLTTDPRLVKEADALVEAGHTVRVIAAFWASWATDLDAAMLTQKAWTCTYVGGDPRTARLQYACTRIRHGLIRRAIPWLRRWARARRAAIARPAPELERAALELHADLYIAHNLGALPAAVHAAERYDARVGFDAEDFHSGMHPSGEAPSAVDRLMEDVERSYLHRCDFLTASTPAVAEAYRRKYGIPRPTIVLNVFPLSMRPERFRPSPPGEPLRLYWFSQTIGADRGLEEVLEGMARSGRHTVELHVRGAWQPGYEAALRQRAASSGVQPDRLIAHAPAAPGDMVRLAAEMDVGLAVEQGTSENRRGALTNKLFTYLLAGNAVVATATPAQAALVRLLGAAGSLYDLGDVAQLACAIQTWADDRARLDAARREAWDWGTRKYNWDHEKYKFLRVAEDAHRESAARTHLR